MRVTTDIPFWIWFIAWIADHMGNSVKSCCIICIELTQLTEWCLGRIFYTKHWGGDPCWHHTEDAQVYIKIQAAVKGRVGDLVQKHFFYACWKSLHISIALIKLSGLNVFISSVEGIGPKQLLPEHYDRLSCLPVKYVFAHFCAPCLHRHDMSSACSSENERRYRCNIMHCVQ